MDKTTYEEMMEVKDGRFFEYKHILLLTDFDEEGILYNKKSIKWFEHFIFITEEDWDKENMVHQVMIPIEHIQSIDFIKIIKG